MKRNGFEMENNARVPDWILKFVRNMFIVSYGVITDVSEDPIVSVDVLASEAEQAPSVCARYVSLTSFLFELSITPTVGDHVLLLSPRHWAEEMFTETKSTSGVAGYKPNLCMALGIGVVLNTSVNAVDITDSSVKIGVGKTTKDADGNDVEHEVAADVTVSGGTSLNAKTIDLNGGENKDDNLIRYSELDKALQKFVTDLRTCMTTTPIAGNGSTQPSWTAFPSIDISAAMCATLTTGKTDPST